MKDAGGSDQRRDLLWATVLAGGFTAFWLVPYIAKRLTMPIGPDVPVYLWWARLAEAQGIGAPGHRPGATVVLVTLSHALHVPVLPLIGGMLVAAGVSVAVVGGLLLRAIGSERRAWILAVVLVGLYARFLIWTFVANLLFSLFFLTAVVVLVEKGRSGRWQAAVLLAAAGLAHPYFYLFGAVILVLAAVGERLRDRTATSDASASAIEAVVLGGAVAGVGVASTFLGPQLSLPLAPDAIMRESGLRSLLLESYRVQTRALLQIQGASLLLQWVAAIGARLRGFFGRFLGSWAAATLVVFPFTLIVPVFAGQRLVFFGFFLPLLAAVGLAKAVSRFTPRTGLLLMLLFAGVVAFETGSWWWQATPFFTDQQLRQTSLAGRIVAATPLETPSVVVVYERDSGFVLPAKALNAMRTSVPPDRIPDVFAYFGSVDDVVAARPGETSGPLRTLQETAIAEISATDREPLILVLTAFNDDPTARERLEPVAPGVYASRALPARTVPGQPQPSTAGALAGSAILVEVVLLVAGIGWARAFGLVGVMAWGAAPAFALAGVTLIGMTLYTVGFPINTGVATGCVVLVAGGGLLGWRMRSAEERRTEHRSS
jgi:hypothetical protein